MEKYVKISIALFLVLSLASLLTNFTDYTDGGDYTDIAKYFSGDYAAKVRTSHSLLYGFMHAPLVGLTGSFDIMKVTNLIFLVLISLSVYYLSNKNKEALLLMALSPIIWYLGPWISPIPLATLLFLWGFFFLDKFYKESDRRGLKNLVYSGIIMGLALSLWDGLLFMLGIFILCSFYGRNVNDLAIFLISIVVGLLPLLALNQYFYGFAFYSLIKYFLTVGVFSLYGGFNGTVAPLFWQNYLAYLIIIPFSVYLLFNQKFFKERKRESFFLILTLLFFLNNPQLRYLLLIWPLVILYLVENLDKKKFLLQAKVFAVISLLIIAPYILQIFYSTNNTEATRLIGNIGGTSFTPNQNTLLLEDLSEITRDSPNNVFVVGNADDHYQTLASLYWGDQVKEFVSIQDYRFYLKGDTSIFEKKLISKSKLPDRRQIWVAGGIQGNDEDPTNYSDITLGIGIGEPIALSGFNATKKYNILYLSEKMSTQTNGTK